MSNINILWEVEYLMKRKLNAQEYKLFIQLRKCGYANPYDIKDVLNKTFR